MAPNTPPPLYAVWWRHRCVPSNFWTGEHPPPLMSLPMCLHLKWHNIYCITTPPTACVNRGDFSVSDRPQAPRNSLLCKFQVWVHEMRVCRFKMTSQGFSMGTLTETSWVPCDLFVHLQEKTLTHLNSLILWSITVIFVARDLVSNNSWHETLRVWSWRKWDGSGDRERPDPYKKEAEIFMDVSVLIGKPLGVLRPSPPITAWKEVNLHTCGVGGPGPRAGAPARQPKPERSLVVRLICLHRGSGIAGIITRAVIISILSGTCGREQLLRVTS